MFNSTLETERSVRREARRRAETPHQFSTGLAAKVLGPLTILTLLAALFGGLILREEYRNYQLNLEQKKAELAWQARTLYQGNRSKLLDVAKLVANNADVQNGMLVGDQYNPLNTIMNFLGHSGIDVINLYDLDGRAFARAQSPSYFGDYDELASLVRSVAAEPANEEHKVILGITPYRDGFALVAISVTRGVSGATGVVVVGRTISEQLLKSFALANHTAIAISRNGRQFAITDAGAKDQFSSRTVVFEEHAAFGEAAYQIDLLTNDAKLFGPFWGARTSIISIAGIAAISSVILTSFIMFMTVVRPVRHLIAVAEDQVSGNLAARAHQFSNDELGRLADILNLLTGNLKASLEEKDRINEQLETRVEQRTEQLQIELSERERAQAALVRAKLAAEAANASKSRFLAAASHDLRQPVHAMTLFVSNLAQQVDTPKAKRTVANVTACVESLCEMFENILDVSKLASGVIEPQIEEFSIDRMLGRLQQEFEGIATENSVELSIVRSTHMLKSDPALVYRILSNLLSNALKNAKNGRVLVGCRSCGDSVEIEIWNTGVGIPQSEIVHIFEEFYRGTSRHETMNGVGFGAGLGLGLSIVEHTAKLLNHKVHVSSIPNRHTRFSLRLPRATAAVGNPTTPDRAESALNIAGLRILVVDDDHLVLRAVQSLLEGWGCIVAVAQSSEEALAKLATDEPPQSIIADYLLQNGETGVNLLRKMEADLGLCIPAIVLSGVASRRLEKETELYGYQLLHKPTQPNRLREALAKSISIGNT